MKTSIDIEGDVIQYSNLKMIEGLSFGEFLKHLLRAFSLSTSLFSGVGDELCEPTIQSVILADIEMIFGVIVMGLGIGTLTRKIVRNIKSLGKRFDFTQRFFKLKNIF